MKTYKFTVKIDSGDLWIESTVQHKTLMDSHQTALKALNEFKKGEETESEVPFALLRATMGQFVHLIELTETHYADKELLKEFNVNALPLFNPPLIGKINPIGPNKMNFLFPCTGTCGYNPTQFGPNCLIVIFNGSLYVCKTPLDIKKLLVELGRKFGKDPMEYYRTLINFMFRQLHEESCSEGLEFAIHRWVDELAEIFKKL